MKVGVLVIGAGNLFSILSTLEKLDVDVTHVSTAESIKACDILIMPGVGAFNPAMEELRIKNLDKKICDFAKTGKLIFGICLGMQLLSTKSFEFGEHEGLNLVPGEVDKINENSYKRIPNVGWYKINLVKKD